MCVVRVALIARSCLTVFVCLCVCGMFAVVCGCVVVSCACVAVALCVVLCDCVCVLVRRVWCVAATVGKSCDAYAVFVCVR